MNIEEIRAYYENPDKDPMVMARMFRDGIATLENGTQQSLARKTQIPLSSISNYQSLLRLPDRMKVQLSKGQLTYKEGRTLARTFLPPARLNALAKPFIDGRLSSMHAEKYVALAKKHPALEVKQLIDLVLGNTPVKEPPAEPEEQVTPTRPPRPTSPEVREQAFALCGLLLNWEPKQTVEDLLATSALKRLKAVL